MALNAARVGTQYEPIDFEATREALVAYARAIDETKAPLLEGSLAEPMFAVVPMHYGFAPALGDSELGFTPEMLFRLVFAEQDLTFHRLIRAGERLATTPSIAAVEAKSSGELLVLALTTRDQAGALVAEAKAGLFIRGEKRGLKRSEAPAPPPAGEPAFVASYRVAEDQSIRYAKASHDENPIHMDDGVAKMVGLPGKILHGMCTMAFASRAVIDRACGGDPAGLARLKLRFAKPVLMGEELTVRAWRNGDRRFDLEVVNRAGDAVAREGLAVVRGDA